MCMKKVELSGITKQIIPGPSGYLEEWQTQEVNVTFASGDIDLLGLPFLKVTSEPRYYLYINKWHKNCSCDVANANIEY